MRLLPWIFLAIAFGLAGSIAWLLTGERGRSAEQLLESAAARLSQEEPDFRGALRELNLAVRAAEGRGDPELLIQALDRRSDFLRQRRAFRESIADLERIQDLGPRWPLDIRLRIAQQRLWLGDHRLALDEADAVLALSPLYSHAHALRAEALLVEYEQARERAHEILTGLLSGLGRERALALVDGICARGIGEPRRASLLFDLDAELTGPNRRRAEELRSLLALASQSGVEARRALYASLELELRQDALHSLTLQLEAGERHREQADLGLAIARLPAFQGDPLLLQRLARSLDAMGRTHVALGAIQHAVAAGRWMPPEFLPGWARMLYEREQWVSLLSVASVLGDMTPDVPEQRALKALADYFQAAAARGVGELDTRWAALARFTSRPPLDPMPGAYGRAWSWRAELARADGNELAERRALEEAVLHLPNEDGTWWLRLAELHEAGGTPQPVLRRLTHAMRLLPARNEELKERWLTLGRRAQQDDGRDVPSVVAQARNQDLWLTQEMVSPYELWAVGEYYALEGEWSGALQAARRLGDLYPGFLPGEDLAVRAFLAIRDWRQAADLLLSRLERAGAHEETLGRLRTLHSEGRLAPDQLLALMRLDPRHTGVLAMARDLFENGQAAVARQALASLGEEELDDAGRLLLAQVDLALGEPTRALERLEEFPAGSPLLPKALALAAEAALELGDEDELYRVMGWVSAAERLSKGELLGLADLLLAKRMWHPAWTLLHALDRDPANRGGDVILRVAVAAMMAGEYGAAREALGRARAFRDDGGAELGRLLLAVERGGWSTLPAEVRELRRSRYRPTAFEELLLAALDERLDQASALAREGERSGPVPPIWVLARLAVDELAGRPSEPPADFGPDVAEATRLFLRGTDDSPRDPRSALALLLALSTPEWAVWAQAELGALDTAVTGRLWPLYLSTLAHQRLGQAEAFRTQLVSLTLGFPRFRPGWQLLETAESERLVRQEHPILIELRARRRAALGTLPSGEEIESLTARATLLLARGDLEGARAAAREALAVDGDDPRARLALAEVDAAAGRWADAVENYRVFLGAADSAALSDQAPAYLRAIDEATRSGALPLPATTAALAELQARLPEDPLVALHSAERELILRPDAPEIAIGRAWQRFAEFRARTGRIALERLRSGALAAWVDFHLRHDPKRALALIEHDLQQEPASVELWLLRGRALESLGRMVEAAELYDTVRVVVGDPRAMRRAASLMADLGNQPAQVARNLDRVQLIEGRPLEDAEGRFIRARALVNGRAELIPFGIPRLAELWEERDGAASDLNRSELGRRYGAALLHRGLESDRARARAVLLEASEHAPRPEEREFLRGLAHLANHLAGEPEQTP